MNFIGKMLAVTGIAFVASQAAISFSPVTSGATESAKKLYSFLAANYGAKTISGMMIGNATSSNVSEMPDMDSMLVRTGKLPALVGFDFLFANGVKATDAWYISYTENVVAAAKSLWNQGGIPAFTWHWKDPSHLVDAFYTQSGNSAEYTSFDFTEGFVTPACTESCEWDKNSTTYKQIVEDIDEIAVHFLKLQDEGVAAIFRPVHEASGKWFWWGARGGAAFQALYNLIYDEMVNVKGVKNLIWVWNPQYATDTDWNPGAAKYDVISLDIYEAWDYTTKFVSGYQTLKQKYGTDKIFAVSENGPIPDFSSNKDAGVVWSWWMPWYQTWDGKFLDQTAKTVWKANMEDACVITLDEMPGWDKVTIATTSEAPCTPNYKLGDLDTARVTVEIKPGDLATNGWLMTTLSGDSAKGNVVIKTGSAIDLSSKSSITLNVFNANTMSGIWFTVAFLGNQSTGYGWAQPEGCWVNAGDSTSCTFDLSTTAKDQTVLTGADYSEFMSNISKIYIEIFSESFNGKVYFDDVKADGEVIHDFEKVSEKITVEQATKLQAEIVGKGSAGIQPSIAGTSVVEMGIFGRNLSVTLSKAGRASIALFDVTGHRVKTFADGALQAGSHQFDLSSLAGGNYIVRIHGAGFSSAKAIRLR